MSTPFYLDYSNVNTSSNFNENNTNNDIQKSSFSSNLSTSSYDHTQATYQKNQNVDYNINLNTNPINVTNNELNHEAFSNSNENLMANEYKTSNIGGWRQHQNYYQLPNDQHGSFYQHSSSYLID